MFVLGITGGIGSGKTAATDQFATHGINVIDADIIAHLVVKAGMPALKEIAAHFGEDILLPNGELDRKALREIVFNDDNEREWLENCLHPIIVDQTVEALKQSTTPYTILSAPLLLEKLTDLTDRVLVIDCPEAIQIDRACRRDDTSIKAVQKIMQQQLSRRERNAGADDIIVNDGTIDELRTAVDDYHHKLLKELSGQDSHTFIEN